MHAEDVNDAGWIVGNGLTDTSANWGCLFIRQPVATQ
jgi:hypothetical protein